MSRLKGGSNGRDRNAAVIGEPSIGAMAQTRYARRTNPEYKKPRHTVNCSQCQKAMLMSDMNMGRMQRAGKPLETYRCPDCRKSDQQEVNAAILAIAARKKGAKR